MLEEYKGEVYVVDGFHCSQKYIVPKMVYPLFTSVCAQFKDYFTYEVAANIDEKTKIYRITGFSDRDTAGILRLVDFRENPIDSTLIVGYTLNKKDSVSWKINRYINNELLFETPYKYEQNADYYKVSLLNKDTNIIDYKIIDTITGDTIHKDYLKLRGKR